MTSLWEPPTSCSKEHAETLKNRRTRRQFFRVKRRLDQIEVAKDKLQINCCKCKKKRPCANKCPNDRGAPAEEAVNGLIVSAAFYVLVPQPFPYDSGKWLEESESF
jgi:Fe-S-cluster-containing hydrogenase component 2